MNSSKSVEVWDILIRVIHWLLVIAITTALLTTDENTNLHRMAGFSVLFLVFGRILWGFFGKRHALFSEFVASSEDVGIYVKSLRKGRARRYLGNNPLSGWLMIVLLMAALTVWFSGYKYYTVKNGLGNVVASRYIPEAEQTIYVEPDLEEEEYWQAFHANATMFLVGLIGVHVLLVVMMSFIQRENLLKAMITGKKQLR